MKKKAFQDFYKRNQETKAYILEISLENYAQLFNGWDASPIRKRNLDPELIFFLEQVGSEIPINKKIELYFYLPLSLKDIEKEERSKMGIINNFKVVINYINKSLKKIFQQILTNIIMSTILMIFAYSLRFRVDDNLFFSILIEGLFVGGWFLLWEAFSLFFFTSYEIRERKSIYKRYLNSKIYFVYKK